MRSESKLFQSSLAWKPFYYPWALEMREAHEKVHWGAWEVDLKEDVSQWKSGIITPVEKQHITQILRLFTQSDVVVGCHYMDIFIPVFKNNEIRLMLSSFASREGTHMINYALLNDTLGLAEKEYTAFLDYKELKDKIDFMNSYDVTTLEGVARGLAHTVCNEGISLFSAFAMLLNYQRRGKMKGMSTVIEWSIRDETQHFTAMTKLFRVLLDEHPELVTDTLKESIYSMYEQAVSLEDAVIDLAYSGGLVEGLTSEEVKQYIRYLADQRLIQLGLKGIFKVKENPIKWLDWIVSGDSMSNFFEKRVTDYNANGLTGDWQW